MASTVLSCQAATYLVNCLENYNPENLAQTLEQMHEVEHSADGKKHERNAALAKAFVPPVDREVSFSYPQVGDKKKGRFLRNHH